METPVLFIGGPADGQRMMLPHGRERYELEENPAVDLSAPSGEAIPEDLAVRRHVYRRVPLATASQLSIFAHDELSVGAALGRLLDRYPGPERRP